MSTLNVPSILEFESNLDFNVNGQMVSSCNVSVVKLYLAANVLEIRLIDEPESSRQRACVVLLSIFTRTVGSKITLFCRKIAVREVEFDAGLDDEGFLGTIFLGVVGGEGEREEDVAEPLSSLG